MILSSEFKELSRFIDFKYNFHFDYLNMKTIWFC